MNVWIVIGSVIGMIAFVPLCTQILRGRVRQNFATWVLFGVMDVVVTATIIAQDGNFLLPAGYSLACCVTVLCILRSAKFSWTKFETTIAFLVVICLFVWYVSGAKMATIASTTAVLVASIPQFIETYRKPWESPVMIYAIFTIAPIFSVIGAKQWTIEERLYPTMCVVSSAVFTFFAARKFWLKKTPEPQRAS